MTIPFPARFRAVRRMRFALILAGALLAPLTAGVAQADPQPPEMVQFLNSFEPEFVEMSRNPTLDMLGALTGLWTAEKGDDNEKIDLVHINNVGPFLIEYVVDRTTGALGTPIGYARQNGAGWSGWFSIACKGCCPSTFWWDKGVAQVVDRKLAIRVDTVKLDPDTCELTDTPDTVDLRSKLANVLDFGEFLPGKKISIVAAPAVGNQSGQYQAAVKLVWDFTGYGVNAVDMVAQGPAGGSQLLNRSSELTGETQFVTDQSGQHRFIIAGYNQAGQPLHFEIESIEIPGLPGIN
jgi:hypothetical protein